MKKVIVSTIAVIAVILGLSYIADKQDSFSCNGNVVIVSPGETLWEIAKQNCDGNMESARNHLVSKYGSVIHVGDVIELPGRKDDNGLQLQQ